MLICQTSLSVCVGDEPVRTPIRRELTIISGVVRRWRVTMFAVLPLFSF